MRSASPPKPHISSQEPLCHPLHHLGTGEGPQRPLPVPSPWTQALLSAKALRDWCTLGLWASNSRHPANLSLTRFYHQHCVFVQFLLSGHKVWKPCGGALRMLIAPGFSFPRPGISMHPGACQRSSVFRVRSALCNASLFGDPHQPSVIVGHSIFTPQFLCDAKWV